MVQDTIDSSKFKTFTRLILVFILIYLFLVSISLMGVAFKGFGKDFAENLIQTTSNPFVGLFIGILATSIVQSSSTTTAILVGMVGSGVITVANAVPIVMGANIGTAVTGMLVSLAHIGRREEFKRAIVGSAIHVFFNIMCVFIMFTLEMMLGILSKTANWMSDIFVNVGGIKFTSPIKAATAPLTHLIEDMALRLPIPENIAYIVILGISIAILFFALYYIVNLMKSLVVKRAEIVLNNVIGKYGAMAIIVSALFTAIIQSSSITTALMIPLVASGILTIETLFPIIFGANIGTTATAILASFATGNIAAVTVAFVHFLFNMAGVFLIYPIKALRRIPVNLAKALGEISFKKRRYAIFFVLTLFYILPGVLIVASKLLEK